MENKRVKHNSFLAFLNNYKKILIAFGAVIIFGGTAAGIVFFVTTGKSESVSEESLETYQLAKKKYLEQNLEEAISLLEQVVKENKQFTNAYFMLGKSFFFNQQYEKARSTWENGLKTNPNHITTMVWLGILYSKDKQTENKAVELFYAILENDSTNIQANYNLGKIYFNRKEYRKAIYYFNNALENELHLSEIHYDFAKIYVELDLKERAEAEINRALSLNSSPALQDNIRTLLAEIRTMETE